MFRTGLLILSPRPFTEHAVTQLLRGAIEHVNQNLYVYLAPPSFYSPNTSEQQQHVTLTNALEKSILRFYTTSASFCENVDIRVILANIGEQPKQKLNLQNHPDVVITEKKSVNLLDFVKANFTTATDLSLVEIDVQGYDKDDGTEPKAYDFTCLGGTFDRLHLGHKILLSKACLITKKRLTVGVTDGEMNNVKTLCELIKPLSVRLAATTDFLMDIKPQLQYNVVPITDPFGPAITDPDLDCIVVSEETVRGGNSVNRRREEKGLSPLDVEVINLVQEMCRLEEEEEKISSSTARIRALGTFVKDVDYSSKTHVGPLPYLIGLTGGSASGKSSVCRRMEGLGAKVIDCDKLGHKAYLKGSAAFDKVVAEFGQDVVGEDGEINRRALGPKVFADKSKLEKLNQIVWPAIMEMAQKEIEQYRERGERVVILDAAVLLEAGWDNFVHEIWVSMVPREEAIRRIMERDRKTEEEAKRRIDSQLSNKERLEHANVVLSTIWAPEVTQKQVEKAWVLLQQRLPCILKR